MSVPSPSAAAPPVAVQSMCNTHTSDARATIEQIARLHDAGCEIIRLAVPDQAAADALPEIGARLAHPGRGRHPF